MDDRSRIEAPLRAVAIASVLFVGIGCHTWKSVSAAPPQGSMVRVTYAAPRDVMATDSAGDSVRIVGVSRWDGKVVRAVPDTMHVRMTSATAQAASLPQRTVMVAVVREPGATVTRRSVHLVKTVLAVWLVAVAIGIIVAPGGTSLPGY